MQLNVFKSNLDLTVDQEGEQGEKRNKNSNGSQLFAGLKIELHSPKNPK